jgi:hypothetical protein
VTNNKLVKWQERLSRNGAAFARDIAEVDKFERGYLGDYYLTPLTDFDVESDGDSLRAHYIRRICAEHVESITDSTIPAVKTQAARKRDEYLATLIERVCRQEIDRLPAEQINDMAERTASIAGATGFGLQWDKTQKNGRGAVVLEHAHPKMLCPQAGIHSGVEDMDYYILKLPTTKREIKARYGVDVEDEAESEPAVNGIDGVMGGEYESDLVTLYMGYERHADNTIGLYAWVNDIEVVDDSDYMARHEKVCSKCGEPESASLQLTAMLENTQDGTYPEGAELATPERGVCAFCGSDSWNEETLDFEILREPVQLASGEILPEGTEVPYYKPDRYPFVWQKNVFVYGKLLGESDVGKILDQQNVISRLDLSISQKLFRGSSVLLPEGVPLKVNSTDDGLTYYSLGDIPALNAARVIDFEGNIQQDMQYLQDQYQASRNILGITDSFQGRRDTTAQSGVSKQFAAAQSAGRLESRRVLKRAAWAGIYELIFKFLLAYCDDDIYVLNRNDTGELEEQRFNRHLFLRRNQFGELEYNTDFQFSIDPDGERINSRENMWAQTIEAFATGRMGDPNDPGIRVMMYSQLKYLHYPNADELLKMAIEIRDKTEQAAQMRMQQGQQSQAAQMQGQQQAQQLNQAKLAADVQLRQKEVDLRRRAQDIELTKLSEEQQNKRRAEAKQEIQERLMAAQAARQGGFGNE